MAQHMNPSLLSNVGIESKRGEFVGKVIWMIENDRSPFSYYLISFFSIIVLRNILEFLVAENVNSIPPSAPVHYSLFYICLALTFCLLYSKLVPTKPLSTIVRVVMTAFVLLLSVPPLDWIFAHIFDYQVVYTYMTVENTPDVWRNYALFFGNHAGATPAMRLEIFLACLSGGFYVYHATSSRARALLAVWLTYSIIFWLFGALPLLLFKMQALVGWQPDTSTSLIIKIFVFGSTLLLCTLAAFHRPVYASVIWKDIRVTRMLHYQGMILLGMVIGYRNGGLLPLNMAGWMNWFILAAGFFFACLFALITNNLADIKIDCISNPGRPSVTGVIPAGSYSKIALASLLLTVGLGLTVGSTPLLLTIGFVGVYSLYSLPPFRLKRILLLSKGLLGLNCLLVTLAGYDLSGLAINTFPTNWTVLLLIGFSLCINVIDLKDIAGDRAEGIKTLPVIVGEKWSKRLIAAAFILTYLAFARSTGHPYMTPFSAVLGGIVGWTVMKRDYKEHLVFITYLITSGFLLLWLGVID